MDFDAAESASTPGRRDLRSTGVINFIAPVESSVGDLDPLRNAPIALPSPPVRSATSVALTARTVQKALKELEDNGHIAVTVSRDRHKPNVYKFILKNTNESSSFQSEKHEQQFAFSDAENTNNGSQKHEESCKKTRTKVRTEQVEEQSEEQVERVARTKSKGMNDSVRRRTPVPNDFNLTADMVAYAVEKAGWLRERTDGEFEGFLIWHRKQGSVFADWSAAWQQWVRKGASFDRERSPQQQGPIIDQNGNPVNTPPPQWQTRQPYRRRSNADFAFEVADDD